MGPGGPLAGLPVGRLDLSEAQRDQLRSLMQANDEALRDIGDRAGVAREGLESAVTAEVVDEGLIRLRAEELALVEADMAVLRAQIGAEAFQLLTLEQQTLAKELRSQMQERAGQRRERMRQRRPRQAQ